ncbi:MAG: SGNH/GDSL hydrolase family protein [Kiritimatiellae bacterium]|jgi:lysophospholipase L1-like esterase|nr:SGNH/GDSL hydrolase family protein [Kiritimatiellia bacterium]
MTQSEEHAPLVFAMGDSISLQYGPSLKKRLAGGFRYDRLTGESDAFRDLDVPRGANGGDSDRILLLLRALLRQPHFRPDILLLNCGLHDIKREGATGEIQVPILRYRENLEAVVELCRAAGVPLVWVRTTPVVDAVHNRNREPSAFRRHAADAEAYNSCADVVMNAAGVPIIDLHDFTRALGDDATLFLDHVHFPNPIREKQGAFIAEELIRLAARE